MADDFEKGSEGAYPGNFPPSLHPYDAEHPSHRAMRQMRAADSAVRRFTAEEACERYGEDLAQQGHSAGVIAMRKVDLRRALTQETTE